MGPILWLFYVNDLELDNFSVIKYADDSSFYKAFDKHGGSFYKAFDRHGGSVSQAICHTQQTVIIIFLINYIHVYDRVVVLDNDVSIFPKMTSSF